MGDALRGQAMMDFLNGAKTYIVATFIIAIGIMHKLGWIDSDTRNLSVTVLAGSGLATLRMAVSKVAQTKTGTT